MTDPILPIGLENTRIECTFPTGKSPPPSVFNNLSGTICLPERDIRSMRIDLEIDMGSIATDVPAATQRLKSAEFFDVERYPQARFVASSIKPSTHTDTYAITGTMSLHGMSRAVSFPTSIRLTDDLLAIDGTLILRWSDFGMAEASKKNNENVLMKISIRARRC